MVGGSCVNICACRNFGVSAERSKYGRSNANHEMWTRCHTTTLCGANKCLVDSQHLGRVVRQCLSSMSDLSEHLFGILCDGDGLCVVVLFGFETSSFQKHGQQSVRFDFPEAIVPSWAVVLDNSHTWERRSGFRHLGSLVRQWPPRHSPSVVEHLGFVVAAEFLTEGFDLGKLALSLETWQTTYSKICEYVALFWSTSYH